MSLHDAYARLTPFEIAFPDRAVVERLSADVAGEVGARGGDYTALETFMTTEAVGVLARALRGPDAAPESTYAFAALLYHAVHFVREGCPLWLVATDSLRILLADDGGWRLGEARRPAGANRPGGERSTSTTVTPPVSAGYLQLPQHLVWTARSPSSSAAAEGAGAASGPATRSAPESLDGVFWTVSAPGMLHVLPVSGVLPDRPGFGALPLPAAPLADAPIWLEADVRPSGEDFASALPGGELDRLYGVQAAGEVLKLLARFFVALPHAEAALREPMASPDGSARPPAAPGPAAGGGPRPSALAYTRVSLATQDG